MNRRSFFATPLLPLGLFASSGVVARETSVVGEIEPLRVTIMINGNVIAEREYVDRVLVPALRDAIAERDVVIIPPGSRQGRELR